MNINKSAIALALAAALTSTASHADLIELSYEGVFTLLDSNGNALQNVSYPYYGDTTWGYGLRTQISGSIQYDADIGYGMATVNPFDFLNSNAANISNFDLKYAGNQLIIGNMTFDWNSSSSTTQIVFDASGLFAQLPTLQIGDVYDASTCTTSGACATPASDGIKGGAYTIGPVPISTSTINTYGQTGYNTTLTQLSLGIDDGIGGSPYDNGIFSGFSTNFDITSLTVTDLIPSIPVPAAVWLFGSGLIGLVSVARRKQHSK